MQKPYRFLLQRVSFYAEEGSAYLRRRRIRSRPFARIWREGSTVEAASEAAEAELSAVAAELLAGEGHSS